MSDEFNFYVPSARFDKELGEEGVWFEVTDEHGQSYGEFKLMFVDECNPRWTMQRDRYFRSNKGGRDKERNTREMFASVAVTDWKLKDGKGKDIPFNPELSVKYFNTVKFAYTECILFSQDATNFKIEVDLGN